MALNKLVQENCYPIVFIGAGISKRYLTESPSWIELLESFWNQVKHKDDFFGTLNDIKDIFLENGYSDLDASFNANIKIASTIEDLFKKKFNQNEIKLDGLTTKDVYLKGISPFKYAISDIFEKYNLNQDNIEEFESWKKFIRKGQIIITTNYDTLIEDSYSDNDDIWLKKYIGQEGFFDNTTGSAELFKIHGCCTSPESIVINEKDYDLFNKNSMLISAKILSSLITSPIIFLGYSLSDANVRKIISDFTSQLPLEDSKSSADRIIIVEHDSNVMEINEVMVQDSEIGSYTLIKTDNYKAIYDKVSSINQGLTPYEIRRYQDVIKKLIVSEGQKGSLDATLLSLKEINKIENDIDMNKPVVVAMGDRKYMYVMPDFITYMKDYIFKEGEILPAIALKFISKEPVKARIPFARHMDKITDINTLELNSQDKENLRNKINIYMHSLDTLIEGINSSNRVSYDNLIDIWSDEAYSTTKKLDLIVFNIKNFNLQELDNFIKVTAFPLLVEANSDRTSNLKSILRKLFYAYDLLLNGDLKKV